MDEIYRHLESVMSSEPTRKRDQAALSTLEDEIVRFTPFVFGRSEVVNHTKERAPPAIAGGFTTSELHPWSYNSFPPLIDVKVQSDLLSELKQVLRDAQANAGNGRNFSPQLLFEALCSFLAGTHRQIYDLLAPLVGAMAQNDPFGRFRRGVRDARASMTYGAEFRPFLGALRGFLAEAHRWAKRRIRSVCVLEGICLTLPRVCLRIEFVNCRDTVTHVRGRSLISHSPHTNGSR